MASLAGAPGAPGVEVRDLSKRFGGVAAVTSVSLAIGRGELFALLGPSGCGKTTLLRLIGGLERPDSGTIRIAGADLTATPPHRRPVHMVFQHYALFPHLTVAENVAFGLRYRRPRRAEAARVAEALALVRLAGLDGRYPHQLSGGQRQRVALARALAPQPEVLLLDEPLGALDQQLRRAMQVELKGLQRTLGITFVLVTHDQDEALALSDRLAVMRDGRLEQMGSPGEVFERPATPFVAEFMGAANFWQAEVVRGGDSGERVALRLACGVELEAPAPAGGTMRVGQAVQVVVRPEKLALRDPGHGGLTGRGGSVPASGEVAVAVTVEERVYQGASTLWIVRAGAGPRYLVSEPSTQQESAAGRPAAAAEARRTALVPGSPALLCWDPRHTVVVRDA